MYAIRDGDGELIGVGRYAPNPAKRGNAPKLIAAGRRGLFPSPETVCTGERALFLVESENDATSAASLRLPAVGLPGVSGWQPRMAQRFAGRSVAVLLDCDEQGRAAARKVAADLDGVAQRVAVLDLDPGRVDGFDIGELVKSCRTDTDRAKLSKRLRRMASEISLAAA